MMKVSKVLPILFFQMSLKNKRRKELLTSKELSVLRKDKNSACRERGTKKKV